MKISILMRLANLKSTFVIYLAYFFVLIILAPRMGEAVKEGFQQAVPHGNSIAAWILGSTALAYVAHRLFRIVPWAVLAFTAGVAFCVGGFGFALIQLIGYCGFVWWLSRVIFARTYSSFAPTRRPIYQIVSWVFTNALLNLICLFFPIGFSTLAQICSGLGIIALLFESVRARRHFISGDIKNFWEAYLLTAMCSVFGVVLVMSAMTEWDSMMSHIAVVRYYFECATLRPDPFLIETWMSSLHQVGSVTFFALGNEFGLKIFNLLMIIFAAGTFYTYGRDVRSSFDRLLVCLMIFSAPIILTTAGTFQYDVPLILFIIACLDALGSLAEEAQFSWQNQFWLATTACLGVFTKMSFVLAIPMMVLAVIYISLKLRRVPLVALATSFTFGFAFLARAYWQSGHILFPYDFIARVAEGDWQRFGLRLPPVLNSVVLLPVATFQSGLYGALNNFTLGFGFLLGYVLLPFQWRHRARRIPSLVLILALLLFPFYTEYLRYLTFIFAPLGLYVMYDLSSSNGKLLLFKRTFCGLLILLNLAMLPHLNWWVWMDARALKGQRTSEDEFRLLKFGPSWSELNGLSVELKGQQSLFISSEVASKYFWINNLKERGIVPLIWSSNIPELETAEGVEFVKALKQRGFRTVIIPSDESIKLSPKTRALGASTPKGQFLVYNGF